MVAEGTAVAVLVGWARWVVAVGSAFVMVGGTVVAVGGTFVTVGGGFVAVSAIVGVLG